MERTTRQEKLRKIAGRPQGMTKDILIRGLPKKHLDSTKAYADSKGMFMKDFLLLVFQDIHAYWTKNKKGEITPHFSFDDLKDNLPDHIEMTAMDTLQGKDVLNTEIVKFLHSNGCTKSEDKVKHLQRLTSDIKAGRKFNTKKGRMRKR